jgi:hypothetical protein
MFYAEPAWYEPNSKIDNPNVVGKGVPDPDIINYLLPGLVGALQQPIVINAPL